VDNLIVNLVPNISQDRLGNFVLVRWKVDLVNLVLLHNWYQEIEGTPNRNVTSSDYCTKMLSIENYVVRYNYMRIDFEKEELVLLHNYTARSYSTYRAIAVVWAKPETPCDVIAFYNVPTSFDDLKEYEVFKVGDGISNDWSSHTKIPIYPKDTLFSYESCEEIINHGLNILDGKQIIT
jgi:hypothetical protein